MNGLQETLAHGMSLTGGAAGAILGARGNRLALAVHRGLCPRSVEQCRKITDTCTVEDLVVTREEIIPFSPHDGSIPSGVRLLLRLEGLTSGLILPLRARGTVHGVLIVLGRSTLRLIPGDSDLLVALGRWAGLALEREALAEVVERQSEQIQALTRLSRRMTNAGDRQPLFDTAVQAVVGLFRVPLSCLWIHDPDEAELRLVAAAGEPGLFPLPATSTRPGVGVVGLAFQQREPLHICPMAGDSRVRFREWAGQRGINAVIAFPLIAGEEPMGVLAVFRPSCEGFSSVEREVLASFASHAAVAIQNARLHDITRDRLRELEVLLEVGQAVSSTLDLTEALRRVIRQLVRILGADSASALLYDASRNTLVPCAGYHIPPAYLPLKETLELPIAESPFLRAAIEGGRPVFVSEPVEPQSFALPLGLPYQSLILAPIIVHEELVGALWACWWTRAHHARPEEIRLTEAIIQQLGLAMTHARLYTQQAELLAQARRRGREAAALTEVGKALTGSLDLSTVLALVVEKSTALMESSAALVYRWDPEAQVLRPLQQRGIDVHVAERFRLKSGEGVAGTAFAEQRPVRSADVREDPGASLRPENRALLDEAHVSYPGILAVPINLGDRPYGVLAVLDTRPRAFAPADVRLLTSFADLVAIALQNATLYEQLQAKLGELQRTEAQLIQSEKLSAVGQLVSGVAHELNNPLTTIVAATQLLMRRDPAPGVQRQYQRISNEALRCARIVENLLTVARQRPPERAPLALNRILEVVLDLRAYQLRVKGIELVRDLAEDLPLIEGDSSRLQQVFLNLVVNAEQAIGSSRGEIIVRTRKVDGEWLRAEVEDSGPGIPEPLLAKIFDPFFTTKPAGQGTGLGLSISAGIVAEHHGRLRAESPPGHGARFILDLPITTPTAPPPADPAPPGPVRVSCARRRILVVDDEEGLRDVLGEILTGMGQEVVMAASGAEALARVGEAAFDLILHDLRLPDMDGRNVWREIHRRDPEQAARVVFITGDIISPEVQAFFAETDTRFVSKPFKIEEIRSLLA